VQVTVPESKLDLSTLQRLTTVEVHPEALVEVAPEVPAEPLSYVSGLLADSASSVLYPESSMAAPSVNLRVNPLQIIRVDPATFVEGEAQVPLQTFACEELATTSEFELLLRAYLVALKEKQKNGKPLSVWMHLLLYSFYQTPGTDVEAVCSEVWKMTKKTVRERIVSGPSGEKVNVPAFDYEQMEFQREVAQRMKASMASLRNTQLEVNVILCSLNIYSLLRKQTLMRISPF
jgi:hypothetical protein